MKREPNTQYILSLSYGKDSIACLKAIEELGWPLDRIIHAEVWATDTIQADLPPMVEFKAKADKIIKERWGIEVEHLCATRNGEKLTYEKLFYRVPKRKEPTRENGDWGGEPQRLAPHNQELVQGSQNRTLHVASLTQSARGARNSKTGRILGFPIIKGNWCTSDLTRCLFKKLPCTRSEDKYCAVPWNCC